MPNRIPLDPKLRAHFDDTPNERRSKAELDAWWDRPFARTRPDGRLEVRCLNGGSWDRSSVLGVAETYEEACVLGEERQAAWIRNREAPVPSLRGQEIWMIRMPQRPDQAEEVVMTFASIPEANAYFAKATDRGSQSATKD